MNRSLVLALAGLALASIGYTVAISYASEPTHAATCDVKLTAACAESTHTRRMQRLTFPVELTRETVATEPTTPQTFGYAVSPQLGSCLEWVDWGNCSYVSIALAPGAISNWRAADAGWSPLPWETEPPPCVRGALGKACLRSRGTDPSGRQLAPVDLGDAVTPRETAVDPSDCEAVACSVLAGDDPDEVL